MCSHQSHVNHQKPFEYFTDHQSFISRNNSSLSSNLSQSPQLRTEPSEILLFASTSEPLSLKLYNENSFPILFKLKTTEPEILLAQPARGFIPSHSFLHCYLSPLNRSEEFSLVIQYAQILNDDEDYQTQWNRLKSEQIFMKKCLCHFSKDSLTTESPLSFFKPMLITLATMTLLTTWMIFKR